MKQFVILGLPLACAFYSAIVSGEGVGTVTKYTKHLTVNNVTAVKVDLNERSSLPAAGAWGAGENVADLVVTLIHGSSLERAAARWTPNYPSQNRTADGCEQCRDITSDGGTGTMTLLLNCPSAIDDTSDAANGVWRYAPSDTPLICTLTTANAANIVAGVYRLSINAAVRTE